VIRASRSASFSGRTSAAEVDKHRPAFRGQKRHARLSFCNPATHEPPVENRPEARGMEAFQEMVLASRPKFLAKANAILRNREDAEDAVQNALLSGYLHLPSFEGRSALKTWFTRIVINAALVIRRKQKLPLMSSRPETSTSDDAGRMERIRSPQPDPETVYAERETLQFINGVLGKMKPALRQTITMTYYDEMTGPEARAVLGVSTATFKSRLVRARRQLLNQAQRNKVTPILRATPFSPDKNPFQLPAVRQPDIGSSEVSFS
jgi:RNA polymerase sigma-70 factor (ECF subfamily)